MLQKVFNDIYDKFRLNYFMNMFGGDKKKDPVLTTTEKLCLEVIHILDEPTIKEVGSFLKISQPNMTYKINSLVKKGFVEKVGSTVDRREVHLRETDKFYEYDDMKNEYVNLVLRRAEENLPKEDLEHLVKTLRVIVDNYMPEIDEFKEDLSRNRASNRK